MNDVLKSLTVLDRDGGGVSSISYESTQPLSKQLEDFAIHIPEGRAISGLLGQLVGTRAVVHRSHGTSEGILTGMATRCCQRWWAVTRGVDRGWLPGPAHTPSIRHEEPLQNVKMQ